ncbi:MAG: hypothetical protein IJ223_01980 [Clostridia bacterium]|nr:hypothetical protein [Clostridia bacterium]
MNKKVFMRLLVIFIIIGIVIGICYLINTSKNELIDNSTFEIKFNYEPGTKVTKVLDKNETDKYDYNIYTYEGSVDIVINGEIIPFREALLGNKITIDEILEKAEKNKTPIDSSNPGKENWAMCKDGGSMEYYYDDYTILKCQKLDGNRDFYIGSPIRLLLDQVL